MSCGTSHAQAVQAGQRVGVSGVQTMAVAGRAGREFVRCDSCGRFVSPRTPVCENCLDQSRPVEFDLVGNQADRIAFDEMVERYCFDMFVALDQSDVRAINGEEGGIDAFVGQVWEVFAENAAVDDLEEAEARFRDAFRAELHRQIFEAYGVGFHCRPGKNGEAPWVWSLGCDDGYGGYGYTESNDLPATSRIEATENALAYLRHSRPETDRPCYRGITQLMTEYTWGSPRGREFTQRTFKLSPAQGVEDAGDLLRLGHPDGWRQAMVAAWQAEQRSGGFVKKFVVQCSDGDWWFEYSPRPYRLGDGSDGTTSENIHLIAQVLCKRVGLDYTTLYFEAHPDERDRDLAAWLNSLEHNSLLVSETAVPDDTDEETLLMLIEDLHDVNEREPANVLGERLEEIGLIGPDWDQRRTRLGNVASERRTLNVPVSCLGVDLGVDDTTLKRED